MPTYSESGEANLRADPKVYASAGDKTPSAKGKDAGGDATNATTFSSPGKSTPGGSSNHPKGVQSFDGEAT